MRSRKMFLNGHVRLLLFVFNQAWNLHTVKVPFFRDFSLKMVTSS